MLCKTLHAFSGLALAAIVVSFGAQSAAAAGADQRRLGKPLPPHLHLYARYRGPYSAPPAAPIEHAGAQRGLMISPRNDELHIEAEAITRGEDLTMHLGGGADTAAALPESIVKYVMRAQETVILDDALSKNLFSADPYVAERRARSILCSPLITQGKLIGILYLENNLAPHVFNAGRVTVLKVLASQAAISLENTRLYRNAKPN
jgi:GAF domain-containing protein